MLERLPATVCGLPRVPDKKGSQFRGSFTGGGGVANHASFMLLCRSGSDTGSTGSDMLFVQGWGTRENRINATAEVEGRIISGKISVWAAQIF